MQDDLEQLTSSGLQVVGISYDDVATLKSFADKQGITFPLLADKGSATIRAYGVHNKEGLPHPGTIVIDQEGVIRGKIFRDGYRDRHPVAELVELVQSLEL